MLKFMILWSLILVFAPKAYARAGVFDQISSLEDSKSFLLQYPTQLTQGIFPKPIHSHNDYWRDVPLLTALSYGASSVEADVYLVDGLLLVGHELGALTRNRSFASLYVQPLLKILQAQNPKTEFSDGNFINGVFDTSSGTSLQLLVDIKTDGAATLPYIWKALDPLRQAGYLTNFTNGVLKSSAITVIGTGNTPFDSIQKLSPRDFFIDGPLEKLPDPGVDTTWDASVAPLASTDFAIAVGWNGLGNISDSQRAVITKLVGNAHSRGIKARFFNTPAWPIYARNNVWRELYSNGVDWLNVDDLESASEF